MAVPKRRQSRSRRMKRRTHDGIDAAQMTKCPRCSSVMRPHTICKVCGMYRGRALMPPPERI